MDFKTLKEDYNWGWLDKKGLYEFVNYGVISEEQYNSIVNPVASKTENSKIPVNTIVKTETAENEQAKSPLGFLEN